MMVGNADTFAAREQDIQGFSGCEGDGRQKEGRAQEVCVQGFEIMVFQMEFEIMDFQMEQDGRGKINFKTLSVHGTYLHCFCECVC